MQLRIYQQAASALAARSIRLVVITPSEEGDRPLVTASVDHVVLHDPDFLAARLLLREDAMDGADCPLPASFLVDERRVIRHRSSHDDPGYAFDPSRLETMFHALG